MYNQDTVPARVVAIMVLQAEASYDEHDRNKANGQVKVFSLV